MIFSSKADTLSHLAKLNLNQSLIPKFTVFNVKRWKNTKEQKKIIQNIKNNLNPRICIRSSFSKEDSKTNSMAGVFDSEINTINEKSNSKQ